MHDDRVAGRVESSKQSIPKEKAKAIERRENANRQMESAKDELIGGASRAHGPAQESAHYSPGAGDRSVVVVVHCLPRTLHLYSPACRVYFGWLAGKWPVINYQTVVCTLFCPCPIAPHNLRSRLLSLEARTAMLGLLGEQRSPLRALCSAHIGPTPLLCGVVPI